MADYRRLFSAAGPVGAGPVGITAECRAVGIRSGEDAARIRIVPATVEDPALLVERRLPGEVVRPVELCQILRDDDPLGIEPGAGSGSFPCFGGISDPPSKK